MMNKLIKLFSICLIFLVCGCGKQNYKTCTIDLTNSKQNYHQKSIYKIYYKKNYVTKIEKKDIYVSDSKDTLDYFNEYKTLEYQKLKNLYSGYTYTILLKDNKLKINSIIDMNKVNIKQMVIDGYIDNNYILSNRLTLIGTKYYYTEQGANCNI